jgi:tetratricopeptide (TPR) repeat protein
MQAKESQQRQAGQALADLEYENLMTALKLALAQQQPFGNAYERLAEYLRARQGFREEKAICELILAGQQHYPEEVLQGKIDGDFFMVYGNLADHNLNLRLYDEARETYQNALQLIPQLEAVSKE